MKKTEIAIEELRRTHSLFKQLSRQLEKEHPQPIFMFTVESKIRAYWKRILKTGKSYT